MKIFISAAERDRPLIEEVVVALQEEHQVFFYKYSLSPGDAFHKQIREAIGQADVMLFFVTPRSIDPKRYTRTELEIARRKWAHPRNRVLPIELEPVDMSTVPAYLKQVTFCKPQGSLAASVADDVARMEQRLKRMGLLSASSGQAESPLGSRGLEGILAGICLGALAIVVSVMAHEMDKEFGDLQLATLHGLMMTVLLWIAAVYFRVRDPFSFLALAVGSLGVFLLGTSVGSKLPAIALYVITSLTVPAIAALTLPTFRQYHHWGGFALLGLTVGLLLESGVPARACVIAWEALLVGLSTYVLSVPPQTIRRTLSPL